MKETIYPSLEEVLYLHGLLLNKFGGTPGVLDRGLLESALARPKSGYYKSLSEQAAALFQSLALNHPFVDGNKRVAFALTAVFLRLNGFKLQVTPEDGLLFIEKSLIGERVSLSRIMDWIEARIEAVR